MIVVFGSVNLDLITRVTRIPRPGETVLGPSYDTIPGGKGANQALAARRAGAKVALAGAVGRDAFAGVATQLLAQDGVDLSALDRVDAPTGAAFIAVDEKGENAITVASGANAFASAASLKRLSLSADDILLLQREVPESEALEAARFAKSKGARIALNLAPAGALHPDWFGLLDFLILNEHEAAEIGEALGLGRHPDAVSQALDRDHGLVAIVTLGPEGAIAWTGGVRRSVPAPRIDVVDTTGAGDTFVGAFAAALDAGLHLGGAILRGAAAGSLACTRRGAQSSMPMRDEIEAVAAKLAEADFIRR